MATLMIQHLSRRTIRRLFSKIEIAATTNCWIWNGALDPHYPLCWYDGRVERVYRVMYAWLVGPVPKGITARRHAHIDHPVCNNKRSCNPAPLMNDPPRVN